MEFRLNIALGNEAFTLAPGCAVAALLREVAEKVEQDGLPSKARSIRDVNGNRVGQFKMRD